MKNIKESEQKQFLSNCYVVVFIILLMLLKQVFVGRLPAVIKADTPHDDLWVVRAAVNLLEGQWLGAYDQYTLIKGAFSAMVMAFARWTGATFIGLNTFLYSLACFAFIVAIKPIFKRNWPLYVIFVMLLFNPVTYAEETYQRIYRNGMSQWQVLFIFSGMLAVFLRRREPVKKLLGWPFLSGFSLWAFNHTREDSVWIMPFAVCAPMVMLFMMFSERKQCALHHQYGRMFVIFLPLIVLFAGNQYVSAVNHHYYGYYLVNDRAGGSYADVARDLYLIKPDESDKQLYSSEKYQSLYYNIYASTLQKAYDVSPAFASIRTGVDAAIKQWDSGENLKDGELFADHVLFALRDGVAAAGYYKDLASTEALYRQIHKELQAAFKSGALEKEGISLSAMAAPWEKGYFPKLMRSIEIGIKKVANYTGVQTVIKTANGSDENIRLFEKMTGHTALREMSPTMTISGWAFAFDDNEQLRAMLCTSDGEIIAPVTFIAGSDVYDYFAAQGHFYENAKVSRYFLTVENHTPDDNLVMQFVNGKENVLGKLPISSGQVGAGMVTKGFACFLDEITQVDPNIIMRETIKPYVDRCNNIGSLYQTTGAVAAIMGFLSYLAISGVTLYLAIKRKRVFTFPAWLCLTAVLLSLLVFVGGVAYVHISTFNSLINRYLASAFPLLIIFWTVGVCFVLDAIVFSPNFTLKNRKGYSKKGDN